MSVMSRFDTTQAVAVVGTGISGDRFAPPSRRPMPASKRAMDLVLTSAILLFALPVMLAVALAIRLDSRGPVLFVQERVGFRGRRFRMFKFRSMRHEPLPLAMALPSDRAGVCYKALRDPRVTRVGRFLRRTSLDELPQLFNVLRGEMSLVGPRPALPHEVDTYPVSALRRLDSMPGLTGLWQVSGRADLDFDTMVALDLRYQRRRSIALDLQLLARTVSAVVSGRGAY